MCAISHSTQQCSVQSREWLDELRMISPRAISFCPPPPAAALSPPISPGSALPRAVASQSNYYPNRTTPTAYGTLGHCWIVFGPGLRCRLTGKAPGSPVGCHGAVVLELHASRSSQRDSPPTSAPQTAPLCRIPFAHVGSAAVGPARRSARRHPPLSPHRRLRCSRAHRLRRLALPLPSRSLVPVNLA